MLLVKAENELQNLSGFYLKKMTVSQELLINIYIKFINWILSIFSFKAQMESYYFISIRGNQESYPSILYFR